MKDQGRKVNCRHDRLKEFLRLLVLLLDTSQYLLPEKMILHFKTILHFMKKIAVRPGKVQHPEVQYTLYVLTCIPESPSMSGTQTTAADLIYLNNLTATA